MIMIENGDQDLKDALKTRILQALESEVEEVTKKWSLKDSLSDSLTERFESLYIKILEVFGEKGNKDKSPYVKPDWIMCGKEIAELFKISSISVFDEENAFSGVYEIKCGALHIFVNELMLKNVIYVGYNKKARQLIVEDWHF